MDITLGEKMTENNDGTGMTIEDPKAVLAALDRAKADAKKYREQVEVFEKKYADLDAKVKELEGSDVLTVWKQRAVQTEVRNQLLKQGVKDVDKVLKYAKVDGVDFDAEGNLTGLDDSLRDVKTDFPELFDAKRQAGGKADIFAQGDVKEEFDGTRAQIGKIFNS